MLPETIQRFEPCGTERSSRRCQVQFSVRRWTHVLAAAPSKVPVELFDLLRRQGHQKCVPNRVSEKCSSLAESAWEKDADGPFIDRLQEVRMPQQKHTKLGRHLAGREVE